MVSALPPRPWPPCGALTVVNGAPERGAAVAHMHTNGELVELADFGKHHDESGGADRHRPPVSSEDTIGRTTHLSLPFPPQHLRPFLARDVLVVITTHSTLLHTIC